MSKLAHSNDETMNEIERTRLKEEGLLYWMIERGSPAEWWVGNGNGKENWTSKASEAMHLTEWGAKKHLEELLAWGVRGPLCATEHLDCAGPVLQHGGRPMTMREIVDAEDSPSSEKQEKPAAGETPRTDALLLEVNEGRIYETEGPITELARTLERELAAKTWMYDTSQRLNELTEAKLVIFQKRSEERGDELDRVLAATERLRNMVAWSVKHHGECLGDHPELLELAQAAIDAARSQEGQS